MSLVFDTLAVRMEGAVLYEEISAPPMNLLGPELVHDLVSLIQRAEADAVWLDQPSLACRCARLFREIFGSADRQVSCRRPRGSPGAGQHNLARATRGLPPGLRSLR